MEEAGPGGYDPAWALLPPLLLKRLPTTPPAANPVQNPGPLAFGAPAPVGGKEPAKPGGAG